jgi:hypothetical protein
MKDKVFFMFTEMCAVIVLGGSRMRLAYLSINELAI